MLKPFCAVLALFLVSPLVTAEIFKCSKDNGKTVYQNFPCNVDSIGSTATAPAPREEATPVAPHATDRAQARAAAHVAAAKSAGPSTEPRVGMTIAQLKNSTWGAPIDVVKEEVVEGVIQRWHYDGNRIVHVDHTGVVTYIAQ